ncbi:MAG: VanZ family protein [Actinomycetota bacterium]
MKWQGAEASNRRWWRATALAALVPCYLAIAWWPFEFVFPRYEQNGFERTADGTLVFDGSSWASGPADWVAEAAETEEFRVSLEVATGDPHQTGLARIFSVSRDDTARNLTIAQRGSNLLVRLRRAGSDANGVPDFAVPDVFETPGQWRAIEVAVRDEEFVVEVDGETAIRRRGVDLGSWDPVMWVVLGNETTLHFGWDGQIREAVVDVPAGRIDYLMTELEVAERRIDSPTEFGWHTTFNDVVVNVLAFLPFGFLLGRRRLLLAVILGFAVSLTMELGQMFLPAREPSGADLITNTAGAALGVLLARGLGTSGYGSAAAGQPHSPGTSAEPEDSGAKGAKARWRFFSRAAG